MSMKVHKIKIYLSYKQRARTLLLHRVKNGKPVLTLGIPTRAEWADLWVRILIMLHSGGATVVWGSLQIGTVVDERVRTLPQRQAMCKCMCGMKKWVWCSNVNIDQRTLWYWKHSRSINSGSVCFAGGVGVVRHSLTNKVLKITVLMIAALVMFTSSGTCIDVTLQIKIVP